MAWSQPSVEQKVEQREKPHSSIIEFVQPVPPKVEVGAQLNVKAATVVEGHIFGLVLEGENWVEAHLCHATKEEASQVVTDLLKSEQPAPTVVLKRKVGNVWYVHLELNVGNKRVDLLEYLKQKDLLL